MKKLFIAMILVMAAVAVNAQRTPVKVSDLNKSITDNISKNYPGFTIKDATKVESNKSTTYHVVVVKGTTQETLLYDKDGKFIKKIVAKEGMSSRKNAPQSTKKTTTTKKTVTK